LKIKRFETHKEIIKQLIEFSKEFIFSNPLIIKENVQENGKYIWKWHTYGDDWHTDPDEKYIPKEMPEAYYNNPKKGKVHYLIWAIIVIILSLIKVLKEYYNYR